MSRSGTTSPNRLTENIHTQLEKLGILHRKTTSTGTSYHWQHPTNKTHNLRISVLAVSRITTSVLAEIKDQKLGKLDMVKNTWEAGKEFEAEQEQLFRYIVERILAEGLGLDNMYPEMAPVAVHLRRV